MIRDFSRDEPDSVTGARDTELTLGGGALFALAGALLLLCAVCFGLGYAAGHRSAPEAASGSVAETYAERQPRPPGPGTKPGASGQQPPVQAGSREATDGEGSRSYSDPDAASRPDMPAEAQATSLQVQPAVPQVQGWMVQIAAVSHPEDAEVLIGALRKHGYSVTARRDLGDSLIHVQTGPFVNRNDANAMRQKLLNDGYNAVVQ